MKNIVYYNAGAGSGKTYKLTHLLSDILSEGKVRPSEVILTTFSELAAGEFRQRSFECLYAKGHSHVANELDAATMGTVHAVALQFLRKYWYLIGISPDLKVLSEDDFLIYVSQSLGEFITEEHLDVFAEYVRYFNVRDTHGKLDLGFWRNDLMAIIEKINIYQLEVNESIQYNHLLLDRIFSEKVDLKIDLIERFRDILEKHSEGYSDSAKTAAEKQLHSLKHLDKMMYYSIFQLHKLLQSEGKEIGKKNLKAIIDDMGTSSIEEMTENIGRFLLSSGNVNTPGYQIKRLVDTMFGIASNWKKHFEEFKKRKHIIGFNDMERLFLQLLKTPEVQQEIKGTYKLMMVDEFQDSNPVQLEIFQLMSELVEQSYWVGDSKQSIYGFRGSNVSLVNELLTHFKQRASVDNLQLERLETSYRTRPQLVELVNRCFVRSFHQIIEEKNVILHANRHEEEELAYPLYHWNCKGNKGVFVEKVGNRLKSLLASRLPVLPKGADKIRTIEPGDIAVLCRTNDDCIAMAKAFQKKGIPVSYKKKDISQQTEVQLVITLLKFMVDTYHKGVRAELLRLLDDCATEQILNDRLTYLNVLGTDEPDQWLDEHPLIARLLAFRQAINDMSISDITKRLVYGLSLHSVVGKWGNIEIRQQNLHALCDLATKYDTRCEQMGMGASISGFIAYLSYAEVDLKIDNATNAVKVMTYHGSKGLEWNYVILDSLAYDSLEDKTFARKHFWGVKELRKLKHGNVLRQEFLIQYLPVIASTAKTDVPKQILEKCAKEDSWKQLYEKEQNELKHLLYVGMTRARDYLTTLSMQSATKASIPPILSWVRNANISPGETCNQAKELWGYTDLLPAYEDITKCEEIKSDECVTYPKRIVPIREMSLDLKYLSPSKLPVKTIQQENIEICGRFDRPITLNVDSSISMDRIGTCIHHIFAIYDEDVSVEENLERATKVCDGYGMKEVIPMVEQVNRSISILYQHLREQYGEAVSIKHEIPFVRQLEGQIMKGEMDLVWFLDERSCVLVDFKNFPGSEKDVLNPENSHYAGNYAAQLFAYRETLKEAGYHVLDTLVYYSVIGRVVRFKF